MRIFVTGGTGLLGSNVIEAALERGHEVLALVRDVQKARCFLPPDPRVKFVLGDLEDYKTWIHRLAETQALVHAAAYFREYYTQTPDTAKMRALNVDIPLQLAREAERRNLKCSVMVSSCSVVNPRADGQPAKEADPANGSNPENGYFMSKVLLEREMAAIRPNMSHHVVVVRPGWMFGPNDHAPSAAGQLVLDLKKNGSVRVPQNPPICIADARDVADAILAIIEAKSPSPVYNLAGYPMTAMEAMQEIARHLGQGSVKPFKPGLAQALGSALDFPGRKRNASNPASQAEVQALANNVVLSSELARRELGIYFRPFEETARDTVAFFQAVN